MAHFAHVTGTPGTVIQVHVVDNAALDPLDEEASGKAFLAGLWGYDPANVIQCSYNGSMRGCYPAPGDTWDGSVFAPPEAPDA
jgi:hypothetical protein